MDALTGGGGKIIHDISRSLSPGMPVWPGDPPVQAHWEEREARTSVWTMGSHSGTHVDAPAHYLPDGAAVDALPHRALIGPCLLIDNEGGGPVTGAKLAGHDLHGVERLLIRTISPGKASDSVPAFDPSFDALTLDAADLIVEKGLLLLGTDAPSVEPLEGSGLVHRRLLEAGVVLLEWLDLSEIPCGRYTLFCAPLKLEGADGAPARAFLVSL